MNKIIARLCFECGANAKNNHHVIPQSRGGKMTIPLCDQCHGNAHFCNKAMSISSLTSAALQAKRARGERAGNVPYGYTADADGRLSPDAGEQAVIAEVLRLRATSLSQRGIVAELERAGIVGRKGKPLALIQVQNIFWRNK